MYSPLDPLLRTNLSRSHDVLGRLTASVNGSAFTYPVRFIDGTVSVSGGAGIRRKLTATIQAHITDAECDPFRTEIRAEYGIRLLNGRTIWTPVGTFIVTDAKEKDRGQIELSGEDRWRRVINARFLKPTVTSGSHVSAIETLLLDADYRIVFQSDFASSATHTQAIWERDRDKAIMELAKSLGGMVHFDAAGVAHLSRPKEIGSEPDWLIGGGDGGVLTSASRHRSQGNVYNAVVVEGENSSGNVSVRQSATITNPSSPLLYGGPYGKRPRYYRSPLISTSAQALSTARALLTQVSGLSSTVEVTGMPHPGLDAGDIIWVEVEPLVWEPHIVDSFTLPLGPGTFNISTRTAIEEGEGS